MIPRVGDVSLSHFVDTRTVHSQPYITNNTFSQRQHQRIQTIKLKAEPRDILPLIYLNYPEIDIMQINLKILSWAVAGDSENTNSIRNETKFSSDVSKKISSLRGTCTTLTLSKCAYVLAVSINEQISYQKETENDKTHKNTNKTDENDMSKDHNKHNK